ncbi:MAG TPA: 50S ribosomal protein L1, partial [Candidatus Saccharimonadales bacterium]|nr:50S ribosomal protein L1 [Candidatus Saccharimonadales bacterium]
MAKAKDEPTKEKQLKEAEVVAEAVPAAKDKTETPTEEKSSSKSVAKSGKRSAKAVKEAEQKQAKEERKAEAKTVESAKPKPVAKPARPKSERAGKKYREAAKLVDKSKAYPLSEALDLATKTSPSKFDGSIELHINLGVDPKQADQNVRGTVALPAGTGKDIRVATLASDAEAEKLFAKFDKGEIDFDVLIATPAMMPKLGKYARLLGPRGLMPNPKSGTVAQDVSAATREAKAGRVEYR